MVSIGRGPNLESVPNPYISPALVRFCGAFGFMFSALSCVAYFRSQGYAVDWFFEFAWKKELSGPFSVTAFVALLGFIFGSRAGSTIQVRDNGIEHKISVLWHYSANGSAIFALAVLLVLPEIIGDRTKSREFMASMGHRFSIFLALHAVATSMTLAMTLLLLRRLPLGGPPRIGAAGVLIAVLSVAGTSYFFENIGVKPGAWLAIGIIHSVTVVALSSWTIRRDYYTRINIGRAR